MLLSFMHLVLLAAAAFLLRLPETEATDFYVRTDVSSASDSNTGTDANHAWASMTKVLHTRIICTLPLEMLTCRLFSWSTTSTIPACALEIPSTSQVTMYACTLYSDHHWSASE